MRNITLILSFFLVLTACSSNETCKDCELKNENDTIVKDTVASLDEAIKSDNVETKTQEQVENLKKIEKKYGEQWDFCTCVIANDSINTAFEKGPSDKQADKLMKRWEYVEVKCKEFLTQPNTTPEERALHEKKVRKCLKNR